TSRFSSCASLSTIACWPRSRSIFPAATRAAYCTETEVDMSGKKDVLRDGDGIAALHGCPQAEVSHGAARSRSGVVRARHRLVAGAPPSGHGCAIAVSRRCQAAPCAAREAADPHTALR